MSTPGTGYDTGNDKELGAPPPAFSVYQPQFFETDDGDIISHDHHLNEDGEALYRFILSQAAKAPRLHLRCHGSHPETRHRTVTTTTNGVSRSHQQAYIENVTDFTFYIDLTQYLLPEVAEPPIWITGDRHAAYRGAAHRQVDHVPSPKGEKDDIEAAKRTVVDTHAPRRRATKAEEKLSKEGQDRRRGHGLPPWVILNGEVHGMEACIESDGARRRLQFSANIPPEIGMDDSISRVPSQTMRQWADEYTASRKKLKEFTFTKEVYGWNFDALRQSIDRVIKANYTHKDHATIEFKTHCETISIRPDNALSRTLSNKWAYVLLWIFLIYPLFIWPFKRFTRWGGGEWRVSGTAFALTKFVHLEDSAPGETVEEYVARTNVMALHPKVVLKATPAGVSRLVGTREGEFFNKWEETIASLVRHNHISSKVITEPMNSVKFTAGIGLDGA